MGSPMCCGGGGCDGCGGGAIEAAIEAAIGAAIGGAIDGGGPEDGAREGGPGGCAEFGAAVSGGWIAVGSTEGCRGGSSQGCCLGCGAMLLTLMRFCGLFAAWTACTAWADDRETSLGGGVVLSSCFVSAGRG